jgi:hypothetical protein
MSVRTYELLPTTDACASQAVPGFNYRCCVIRCLDNNLVDWLGAIVALFLELIPEDRCYDGYNNESGKTPVVQVGCNNVTTVTKRPRARKKTDTSIVRFGFQVPEKLGQPGRWHAALTIHRRTGTVKPPDHQYPLLSQAQIKKQRQQK